MRTAVTRRDTASLVGGTASQRIELALAEQLVATRLPNDIAPPSALPLALPGRSPATRRERPLSTPLAFSFLPQPFASFSVNPRPPAPPFFSQTHCSHMCVVGGWA